MALVGGLLREEEAAATEGGMLGEGEAAMAVLGESGRFKGEGLGGG